MEPNVSYFQKNGKYTLAFPWNTWIFILPLFKSDILAKLIKHWESLPSLSMSQAHWEEQNPESEMLLLHKDRCEHQEGSRQPQGQELGFCI